MRDEPATAASAAADPRDPPDEAVRDRIVRLAFGGDEARFARFMTLLHETIPPDVTIILRGSAVTGQRWADGAPFDGDGPGTSDLDLTLIGKELVQHWTSHYIPGLHTEPLSDEHPDVCPAFTPLRAALCKLAGRPVNIQATTNLVQFARDVVFGQPYHVLVEGEDVA